MNRLIEWMELVLFAFAGLLLLNSAGCSEKRERESEFTRQIRETHEAYDRINTYCPNGLNVNKVKACGPCVLLMAEDIIPKKPGMIVNNAPEGQFKKVNRRMVDYGPQGKDIFTLVSEKMGIPESVLKAIYEIESNNGRNYGSESCILVVGELDAEMKRELYDDTMSEAANEQSIINRTDISAYAQIVGELGVSDTEFTCSKSGKLGLMQFYAYSWIENGLDANGDRRCNPWDIEDAVYSLAFQLNQLGWANNPRMALKKRSLRKDFDYADKVLKKARSLGWGGK